MEKQNSDKAEQMTWQWQTEKTDYKHKSGEPWIICYLNLVWQTEGKQ